jgi:alanine racemase
MNTNGYSSWLEIYLGAIKNNIRKLREISHTQIMAVVKANGYGHGTMEVARAATEAGAEWCGVARLEEGVALRQAGLPCRMLVLGYTSPDRVPDAVENRISLTVYDLKIAEQYAQQAKKNGGKLKLHLKVDTGMGRLGISPQEAEGFLQEMAREPAIEMEGIFTHFARADELGVPTTREQLDRFIQMINRLKLAKICPPVVHAANSAASLLYPDARFDLIRPGIAIYGLHPSDQVHLPDGFLPALAWKSRLTSVRKFPPGHGISYGHTYRTIREELIGAIAIGYADGYRRVYGNMALVNGVKVPVVGNVCMDQCMLQLDHVPDAKIGDEVVLIGSQGDETITAEEVAARWGTINYEVITGLAARLPRISVDDQKPT